jgi:hypothetical protein
LSKTYRIPSLPVPDARKRCPWNKSYRVSDTLNPTDGPRATINSNKNAKYELISWSEHKHVNNAELTSKRIATKA